MEYDIIHFMTCNTIISFSNSFFNVAEFPKTPSPKPARIPPQTPPAGGKFSRGFAKSFPPENSFGKTESAFRPATLPEYLEGRTPKEKHPFLFQKKIHPRQIRNARSVFLSGLLRLCEAVAGRFIPRRDWFQKRFEFCTMNTAKNHISKSSFLLRFTVRWKRIHKGSELDVPILSQCEILVPAGYSSLQLLPFPFPF